MAKTLCVAVDFKEPGPRRDYFLCFENGSPHRGSFLADVFTKEVLSQIYSFPEPDGTVHLNGLGLYKLLELQLDFYISDQEKKELRKDYRITSDGRRVRF